MNNYILIFLSVTYSIASYTHIMISKSVTLIVQAIVKPVSELPIIWIY